MCNAAGKYSWSKCWEPKLGGSSHEQITIDRRPSRDSQVSTTFLIMLYPIIVARTTNDVRQMIVEHHHSIDFTALLAIHSPPFSLLYNSIKLLCLLKALTSFFEEEKKDNLPR